MVDAAVIVNRSAYTIVVQTELLDQKDTETVAPGTNPGPLINYLDTDNTASITFLGTGRTPDPVIPTLVLPTDLTELQTAYIVVDDIGSARVVIQGLPSVITVQNDSVLAAVAVGDTNPQPDVEMVAAGDLDLVNYVGSVTVTVTGRAPVKLAVPSADPMDMNPNIIVIDEKGNVSLQPFEGQTQLGVFTGVLVVAAGASASVRTQLQAPLAVVGPARVTFRYGSRVQLNESGPPETVLQRQPGPGFRAVVGRPECPRDAWLRTVLATYRCL